MADPVKSNDHDDLARYSAALDEIHRLRNALAYEASVTEAHLDLVTFPKSRRPHADEQVARMRAAARGETRQAYETNPWMSVPGFAASATAEGLIRGPSGKILKPYICSRGYHHVLIRNRKLPVHHAVLLAFGFARPDGAQCRHLDGDPGNNSLSNLRWGTSKENAADRLEHGHTAFGEEGSAARLTNEQVLAIKRDSRSSRLVGRDYGVAHTTVLQIRRGNTWSVALEQSGLLDQEPAA